MLTRISSAEDDEHAKAYHIRGKLAHTVAKGHKKNGSKSKSKTNNDRRSSGGAMNINGGATDDENINSSETPEGQIGEGTNGEVQPQNDAEEHHE